MKKCKIVKPILVVSALLGLSAASLSLDVYAKDSGNTKIHFISLASSTDSILLESNGHYGMIDSGEDWDYPDGSDARYPLRSGITKGIGYEQQVINYLKSVGVEKLDFYIATHSHSDHIGSGDEILDAFPTDRLYVNQYDDSYMTDAHGTNPEDSYYNPNARENRLWDNQYVYDNLIAAAKRNGAEIITDLDKEENKKYCSLSLGDMFLELMNVERKREKDGTVIPVADENDNCIVTRVTAYGRTALLTSDLDPTEGDTAKIADQLIEEMGTDAVSQTNKEKTAAVELQEEYPEIDYTEESEVNLDLPETRSVRTKVDESQKNTGKTISIDLMKMLHHSIDYNNTTYFLTSLNPTTVVVTGYESWFNARERDCLPNSKLFATVTDSAAVVATFAQDGIHTTYEKIDSGWRKLGGKWYYFDENGRTFKDSGTHIIDGKVYCFDKKGALETADRWVKVDGKWRYWLVSGTYKTSQWFKDKEKWYYLDQNGDAVTGWKKIGSKWYYFESNTAMASDTWIGNYYVNTSGAWEPNKTRNQWIKFGNRWWYRHADGSYTKSNWEFIDKKWYYFDQSGWMVTGWKLIKGKYYYLTASGVMASDTWIGNYYVNTSGAWEPNKARNRWIKSGDRWWYRHANGSYTKSNWEFIDKKWYYFDQSGWMVTGWKLIKGKYYYLTVSGAMASDTWIGDFYVDSSGVWSEEKTRN